MKYQSNQVLCMTTTTLAVFMGAVYCGCQLVIGGNVYIVCFQDTGTLEQRDNDGYYR